MVEKRNTKRSEEKQFPFTFVGWDEGCGEYGDIQFYDVEWMEDWGRFKKGEKCDTVFVEHCKSTITAYNEDGDVVVKTKFKSIPVE